MLNAKQVMYEKLGESVVKALKMRHFEAHYCLTKKEALNKVFDLIPDSDVVSWGGSKTLVEVGIIEELKARNYTVLDRDAETDPVKKQEIARKALLSDTYLMSSNAITMDGQLYNIDGNGNRLGALVFGPKSVIIVAGMNKVVKSIEDAEARVRNYAAPMNAQRFKGLNTPCQLNGSCADCISEKSICAQMVRTRICRPEGRIKVILVGEDLGM